LANLTTILQVATISKQTVEAFKSMLMFSFTYTLKLI